MKQPSSPTPTHRRRRLFILAATVLLAAAMLMVRSLPNAMEGGHDFALIYASARAMWDGENPYQTQPVQDALAQAGYQGELLTTTNFQPGVYPPSTYVVLGPLAKLSWRPAVWAWLAIHLAAIAALVALLRRMGWPKDEDRITHSLIAAVIVLAAAPLHTGLRVGQIALLTTLLIIASFGQSLRKRALIAGALGGIAMALKPQLGVIMLAYFITRAKWKSASACAAVFAVLNGVGVIWLNTHRSDWLNSFLTSWRQFSVGGAGDMSNQGMAPFHFVTLNYLLHQLTDHRTMVGAIVVAFGAVTTLVAMLFVGRRRDNRSELLFISILTTACLLSAPHRFYDAVALTMPAIWLAGQWRRPSSNRTTTYLGLAALAAFLIPGAAMLYRARTAGWVSEPISQSLGWRLLVMPHQIWALLMLLIVMLVALKHGHGDAARQT